MQRHTEFAGHSERGGGWLRLGALARGPFCPSERLLLRRRNVGLAVSLSLLGGGAMEGAPAAGTPFSRTGTNGNPQATSLP